jgi:hypothetical protein
MAATRTIAFTLNGEPVSAVIATHHTLLEVVRYKTRTQGLLHAHGRAPGPEMGSPLLMKERKYSTSR